MSEDSRSCPSCGARVSADASVCDLCGTSIEDVEASEEPSDAEDEGADRSEEEAADGLEEGASTESSPETDSAPEEAPVEQVYCHECGWENPPGANYCSRCGTELQDVTGETAPVGTRPVEADLPTESEASDSSSAADEEMGDEQAEMGQQILLVVGTALLLVLGLFFATQWSQQYEWGSNDSSSGSSAATEQSSAGGGASASSSARSGRMGGGGSSSAGSPAAAGGTTDLETLVDNLGGSVDGSMAGQIDSLRALVDETTGSEQRQHRTKLARLYVGAGAPGRAALVQRKIAKKTERVADRRRAANLLYKWMRQVEQQSGRAKVADVARHVAEAYAAVVEQRPQDLDARTRMGEAYLLTNNPMKGIRAINQVLKDDSTFVPARFQKGLALLKINRLDQAVAQFEKVMTFASQDDPFYQQAKRAIEVIRKQRGSSGQGASSGS